MKSASMPHADGNFIEEGWHRISAATIEGPQRSWCMTAGDWSLSEQLPNSPTSHAFFVPMPASGVITTHLKYLDRLDYRFTR